MPKSRGARPVETATSWVHKRCQEDGTDSRWTGGVRTHHYSDERDQGTCKYALTVSHAARDEIRPSELDEQGREDVRE